MSGVDLESGILNPESGKTCNHTAVTGSTGMIGSHLVAELVRTGHTGIVLPVRDTARVENIRRTFRMLGVGWNESAVTVVEASLTDSDSLAGIFRGVDTVFNCAGVIMTGDLTEQQLIDNNVSVSRGVAEAAVKAGVRRLIHTSSIVVLAPNSHEGNPIDETCAPHGDAHGSAYGSAYARGKYLADLEMRHIAGHATDLTILYPAVVLGEGDWSMNGSSALIPVIASGLPFYAGGVMAYVDVRDVARAYIAVAECPDARGRNFIVSGANLTYRELIDLGAGAAGRRKPFIKVGVPLALAIYGLIRLATALRLMKDRSVTRRNLDSVLYGNRYSGEKLTEVCGFRYTPANETVDRVVKAYLNER